MDNITLELESLYLEAKNSNIEDEQKMHMLIELIRQIEFMKQKGNTVTIDIDKEFGDIYEGLKSSNMPDSQRLQLRLEVLRHLSYK